MNILLINHYAGSIKHGMEYRPFYMAREWVRQGHCVTIVAASHSHVRTQPPSITSSVTEEKIDGIRYLWLKTPAYHGNGLRRAINILVFVQQLLRQKVRLTQPCPPNVVIASSTYPLDIVPAHKIARQNSARLVFEVHDLWPLSPIELGGISPWHPFILLMQWAENYAYRNADRVVSMLPKAESHMREHGLSPDKFVYVPNGIEVAEWQVETQALPPEHAAALATIKARKHLIVGYAGAHGIANALPALVEAAAMLQTQPVTFVLVGQGPEKPVLQRRAQEQGLTNILFLPPIPKLCVPKLLQNMDILFFGMQHTPLFRFGISPNKLMDYMMAGRPVIQAVQTSNDLVSDSRCGVTICPQNPRATVDAIHYLMGLAPEEREAMGRRGRAYVLAHHDYRVLAHRFLEALQ